MDFHRRDVMLALPGLLFAARVEVANAATPEWNPKERDIAALVPRLAASPFIAAGSRRPNDPILYMLTNVHCGYCQAFHRQFPVGLSQAQMRYLVVPWDNENPGTLNYLYASRREADYYAYMRRALPPQAANFRGRNLVPLMADLFTAAGRASVAGLRGTPLFLFQYPHEGRTRFADVSPDTHPKLFELIK